MSNRKRSILIFYFVSLIAICTYVPWIAGNQQNSIPAGYSFIWQPPQNHVVKPSLNEIFASKTVVPSTFKIIGIDTSRLIIEAVGITAIMGIAFLLSSYKHNNK
jgi:hypothetical protein